MGKDKALKLALEALEYASTGNRRPEIIGPAITDIKEALAQPVQEPVQFLAGGTRFKLSLDDDGKVNCFGNWKELDGRWVALVAAEDDCHLTLTAPLPVQPEHGVTTEASLRFRLDSEKQKSADLLDEVRELKGIIEKLRAAQPVQEQEPVAWMIEDRDNRHFIFRMQKPEAIVGETLTPLYTAPPLPVQRQPLTDEQKDAERYRWLRNPATDVALVLDKRTNWVPADDAVIGVGGYWQYEYRAGEELDAAVDQAIEAAHNIGAKP